ncbi:X-ray repair cross-complementing protein 5 Ku80 [Glossina fuscipes fuscipes]
MAFNKENLVFVLDVRQGTSEEFKQKSIKICANVIKQKICCAKKDFISFVLVGTAETCNEINSNDSPKGYLNIFQYGEEFAPTSWRLLMNFYQFVNETAGNEGKWLDAVVVAFNMLKSASEQNKVKNSRIVLFYDFDYGHNTYDAYNEITQSLLQYEVNLIVVSDNIGYIDNADNNEPQAVFLTDRKSYEQLENQKYALRLVSHSNAKLSNCTEAFNVIVNVKSSRPWCWNSNLRIGSAISIAVSGIIMAKNESTVKLRMIWNETDEELTKEWGYFISGNQICPEQDSLMDGYMLGGSPIPYDETVDDDKLKLPKGLTFMGFIPRNLVYDEYFSGQSTYLILHQRGMTASAKKLDALVRVLLKCNRVILCWKVYSEKFNKPRIVVLIPNEPQPDCPASLNMLEIAHHAQYHFFEFPKLATKKTECSSEQLNAIDNLIDSMDLSLNIKESELPRERQQKSHLPLNQLPHIFEHNFMDIMERKIICKASEDDAMFEEMLNDKNFVEKFWKLPDRIEEHAKEAAKKVKSEFPLLINREWLAKVKAKINAKYNDPPNKDDKDADDGSLEELDFDHVRSLSPAEDFKKLLKHYALPIKNQTQRDIKFNHYASQLRSVVWNLLFKPKFFIDFNKVADALEAYRKRSFVFNAYDDYNIWILNVKAEIMKQRLSTFWEKVIVKKELGLCFLAEPSLEEQRRANEFYSLEFGENSSSSVSAEAEMNNSSIDDLLADITSSAS